MRPTAETIVVKYGGNAITDLQALDQFSTAIVKLVQQNKQVIIIHGGGPQINHWLERTQTESYFIDGQRYTNQETLSVVEMVLCAHVNKAIVRALQQQGLSSVGISGEDGFLLTADPISELGEVGKIKRVNPELPLLLLKQGYIPVIAPVACSEESKALNVNADFAAAHLAGKMNAAALLLMTNVAGILDKDKQRLPEVNRQQIAELTAKGVIYDGMLPKTNCALTALDSGCQSVVIFDGSNAENLIQWLTEPKSIGTKILP